jgi:hypothetical protein
MNAILGINEKLTWMDGCLHGWMDELINICNELINICTSTRIYNEIIDDRTKNSNKKPMKPH